jgi:hypothetical protein
MSIMSVFIIGNTSEQEQRWFYSLKRQDGFNEMLSPINFEKPYFERLAGV